MIKKNRQKNRIGKQNYPIRLAYIDTINAWWPPEAIAAGMGVPGFAKPTIYNYFALAFWMSSGPADIVLIWSDPVKFFGIDSQFGKTKEQIQQNLKTKYNAAGIKILISAFGGTEFPTTAGKDPITLATQLGNFVAQNNLDGVDIDWQDNSAMQAGKGEDWLIKFTTKLREILPNHIITHAPQAPYFKKQFYKNGAYITIDKQVGSLIDFYNVQFYNQGNTKYDTYQELFIKSSGYFSGTSVRQIIDRGVPSEKIVVGKPAIQSDATNTGYVDSVSLGQWVSQAYSSFGWYAGVMFWQYKSDIDGALISNFIGILKNIQSKPLLILNPGNNTQTNIKNPIQNTITNHSKKISKSVNLNYPIRLAYIDTINAWWPPEAIAAGMGVPGFAKPTIYNYFALAFWMSSGPADIVLIWSDPVKFFGIDSQFGKTKEQIQQNLKTKYNAAGIKILISAFGGTEFPTTAGKDPITLATQLGNFVAQNNLDGVDIDWQDNSAMQAGKGEDWLIKFTTKLREILPNHIITHAPQAPYFKKQFYKNGAYITIDKQVGSLIDFYNVQFYNQGNTKYDTYQELFIKSSGYFSGTSVRQIIDRGVPSEKIVVGKPAIQSDATNTGYVDSVSLGQWVSQAYSSFGWYAGVMFWQYKSDIDGALISNFIGILKNIQSKPLLILNPGNNTQTNIKNPIQNTITNHSKKISKSVNLNYPIRLAYIDTINAWWPPEAIAAGMGVPGFAKPTIYNYFALAFWMSSGPADIVLIWSDPVKFFGIDSQFGKTKEQIQQNLKTKYNAAGIKILISAFGGTEFPTTAGKDPITLATQLGNFVAQNNLDGVDIDWQDNSAMQAGKGEDWLIKFTTKLREILPNHIITHAPQAPYFKKQFYKNGAYITIDKQVGSLIDFYNVQFYNQGNTKYDTYQELFIKSSGYFSGTSVRQIIDRGVPSEKIVVGKPAIQSDATNTGYVDSVSLGQWVSQAYSSFGWYAGVMFWQYKSDIDGALISNFIGILKNIQSKPLLILNPGNNTQTNIKNPIQNTITNHSKKISKSVNLNYPIRLAYIDTINAWWPPEAIAAGMGVPGFAKPTIYNYFALAFWMSSGPADIVLIWSDPVKFFGIDSQFGKTKEQIQQNLKTKYNAAGIKILISAFGGTEFPTTAGKDPITLATQLGNFVAQNNLDGVDIDWQDNSAMQAGKGEDWLIKFTTKLREILPNHIITHAPQAPYFKKQFYKNGAYITIDKQVGSLIDFYNVQFYNQGNTKYDTYQELFIKSSGYFSGTSVRQIIDRGVPSEKIVVGKPAIQSDATNTGYVDSVSLGQWVSQAYSSFGWYAGVMFWQYKSDIDGALISNFIGILKNIQSKPLLILNPGNNTQTNIKNPIQNTITNHSKKISKSVNLNYPIRLAYIDTINAWWPPEAIAAGMGVPGFAKPTIYNYFALAFWMSSGPADIVLIWSDPVKFFGIDSQFGKTKEQIQQNLKTKYNAAGIKILISAFGGTEFPTTAGKDPITLATQLGNFVAQNNLDGVDIDWQDNSAMQAGKGEDWLIKFTTKLREILPNHIITHAPQAPYFKKQFYKNGAYITIDKQVGSLIDFYNVQFYNQGNTKYDTYQELFIKSSGYFSGTSVRQIIDRGVPSEKIVVGKPAIQSDATNTGYVDSVSLGQWVSQAYSSFGWYAGVMFWQYKSDLNGTIVSNSINPLKQACLASNTCK